MHSHSLAAISLAALADLDLGQLTFRWIHLIAGVLWIGMLWFFNWVNAAFAATMDAETKRKVIPELMPRALYWFRWGAAFTWISGVGLMMLLYYSSKSGYLLADGTAPELMTWLPAFIALIVGFAIYDVLFKFMNKGGAHIAGVLIWAAIAIAFAYVMQSAWEYSGRAVLIHIGALFGTAMAANVWMRIWPAQKRIITAIKNGAAPNPADPALAGLRSKHNTYMSVPLLLFMVSVHMTGLLGAERLWLVVAVVLAIGWLVTFGIYKHVANVKGF